MSQYPQIGKYVAFLKKENVDCEKGFVIFSTQGEYYFPFKKNILRQVSVKLEELCKDNFKRSFFINREGCTFPPEIYVYDFVKTDYLIWRPEKKDYVKVFPVSKEWKNIFDKNFDYFVLQKIISEDCTKNNIGIVFLIIKSLVVYHQFLV